jgi:hypothetical protein
MIRVARTAIAVALVSSASPAWALCPNCLAQRQTLTPTLELLGLFLLVPFAVAAIAIWAVRRALYGRLAGAPPVVPPSVAPSAPPSSPGADQAG